MLTVVKYGEDTYDFPALVVLGCFDGLHRGHMSLIKQAALEAKINGLDLGVMMFTNGKGGKQIYSFEERLEILSRQPRVKFVLAIDFNDEFKKTAPGAFLDKVCEIVNVKAFMSGKDFRFGKDAKGKCSTIKNYAEKDENVWFKSVKAVEENGAKIGDTAIREKLQSGDIEGANALLGRSFSVTAPVIAGDSRGRGLGFPTANLRWPEGKIEIKQGVYNVLCDIDGTQYRGIANYGGRPTFNETEPLLEVHLDGFEGDLYGKSLCVQFVSYIRGISKFSSPEALMAQLASDLSGGGLVEDPGAAAEAAAEAVAVAEAAVEIAECIEQAAEKISEETGIPAEDVAEILEEVAAEEALDEVADAAAEEIEEAAEEIAEAAAEEIAEAVAEEAAEAVAEAVVGEIIEEAIEEAVEESAEEEAAVEAAEEIEGIAEAISKESGVSEETVEKALEEYAAAEETEEVAVEIMEEAADIAAADIAREGAGVETEEAIAELAASEVAAELFAEAEAMASVADEFAREQGMPVDEVIDEAAGIIAEEIEEDLENKPAEGSKAPAKRRKADK